MEKGKNYIYTEIEDFANTKDYEMHEWFINNVVGESFIVLKSREQDLTISFMLCGSQHNGFVYKCIYSDLKK